MKIEDLIIRNSPGFKDDRGEFYCSYQLSQEVLNDNLTFKEWDFSYNYQNVLRGLHCDFETWKLIECIYGEVFWVAVDARQNSNTFKNIFFCNLSKNNHTQVLVPPGVLTGFYVHSEEAIFYYRQTKEYSGGRNQTSVVWNDPDLKIPWPCTDPTISERDQNAHKFMDILNG
jgi:dTDP-4-dehydrorhamnose 3,5-epimerase